MKKIQSYLLFILIACMALISFLLVIYVLDRLYTWNDAILGGVLGFIGSIIGGGLTLIGVRWTLLEQRKQFVKPFIDNASLIHARLAPKIVSLNTFVNNINGLNSNEQFDRILTSARRIITLIDESSEIINKTEVQVIRQMEFIETQCENIVEWIEYESIGQSDEEIVRSLKVIVNYLNHIHKSFEDYIEENSKD